MTQKIQSFQPVASRDARILILGSMPSVQSLAHHQYYAHPRNHFWPLMSQVLHSKVPEDYPKRCLWLCEHHVALWDAVQQCARKGSLDANIREAVPNPIGSFLQEHGKISAIFFNGTAAKKYFERFHHVPPSIQTALLPSSSPIPRPGLITVEDKIPAWMKIWDELQKQDEYRQPM